MSDYPVQTSSPKTLSSLSSSTPEDEIRQQENKSQTIHQDSQPISFRGRIHKGKGKERELNGGIDSISSNSHSHSHPQSHGNSSHQSDIQSINDSNNSYDSFTPTNPSSPLATFDSFTSTPPTGRLSLDDSSSNRYHKRNQLSHSSSLFNPLEEEFSSFGQSFGSSQTNPDHDRDGEFDYFNPSTSLATTAATSYSPSSPRILSFSCKGKGREITPYSKRYGELERNEQEQTSIGENSRLQGNQGSVQSDGPVESQVERLTADDQSSISIGQDQEPLEEVEESTTSLIPSERPSQESTNQTHPNREASLPPEYLIEEISHQRDTTNGSRINSSIPLDYALALADESAWRRTRSNRNNAFFGSLGELPPYATEETRLPRYQAPPPSTLNPNSSSPTTERRRFFRNNGVGGNSRFSPSGFLRRMRTNSLTPSSTNHSSVNHGTPSNESRDAESINSAPPTPPSGLPSSSTSAIPSAFYQRPPNTSSSRRPFTRADSAPDGLATLTGGAQRDNFIMGPRPRVVTGISNSTELLNSNVETVPDGQQERRSSLFSNFRERVRGSRKSSLVNSNSLPTSAVQSPQVSRPVSVRSGQSRPSSSAGWSTNGSLMSPSGGPNTSRVSAFRFPNPSLSPNLSGTNSRPTSSNGGRPPHLKNHGKTFSLRTFSDIFAHSGTSGVGNGGSGNRRRDRRTSTSSVPEIGGRVGSSRSGSTSSSALQTSLTNQEVLTVGLVNDQSSRQNRENRLSTVHHSPDLRPQPSNIDLDSEFQLLSPTSNPSISNSNTLQNRSISRRLPNENDVRPLLLRQGYSAPLASTSFSLGSGLQSLDVNQSTITKKDFFNLILPREMRVHIFGELIQIHEDEFIRLVESDAWRGSVARESVWVGKEKGIRELVKISRVCRIWQSLALDGQLWQEMNISEFPSISERALVSIARSAGHFVKDLDLTGLSNLPSSALIALTQAQSGEASLSDSINQQSLNGRSTQVDSNSMTFPTTTRSASVGQLDLNPITSSNLFDSNETVTRLTSLKLKGCTSISSNALHHLLIKSPRLILLSLSDLSCVTDQTLELISQNNLKLEELDLSRCKNITGDGVTSLASSLHDMKRFRAVGMNKVNDLMLFSISKGMRNLELLNLSYSDITDSNLASFVSTTETEESENVVELTPREAGEDISSSLMFYRKRLNLKHLALSACRNLTDKALMNLAHSVPKLEILELANFGVNLTDRGLCKLIETIPLIRRLDLEGATEITEVTIEALTPPASFSEMLGLNPNPRISSGRNRRSFLSIIRNESNNVFNSEPIASTSTSTSNPSTSGSQLTHLILSHSNRIEPGSILTLIQRAPFLIHLHLDDTRSDDLILKSFVTILKEREVKNGFISLIDCRSITRTSCNELLNNSGDVRTRNGRRGFEFNQYLYDDIDIDDQDQDQDQDQGRISRKLVGLDECNQNKIIFKSFWSWQNVDNRLKIIKKKESKLSKKGRNRLRSLTNGNGNGNGNLIGDDDDEERSRWNRLTSVMNLDEDEEARNCSIM